MDNAIKSTKFYPGDVLCKLPGYLSLKAIAFCRPDHNFSGEDAYLAMRLSRHCFERADNSTISAIFSQLAF